MEIILIFVPPMPSLATVLSQAENAIIHLDEYKNDIDVKKIELLKGLWNCQSRNKLDVETQKSEQSKVLSGLLSADKRNRP
ncbi:MAG: hypothetical protein J1E57_11990 [Prevotella sp.]|nr:hypothetical protein [Prevotella sp.]